MFHVKHSPSKLGDCHFRKGHPPQDRADRLAQHREPQVTVADRSHGGAGPHGRGRAMAGEGFQ